MSSEILLSLARNSTSPLASLLDLELEIHLDVACRASGLQDSFSFRKERRSLLLARYVLEKGIDAIEERLHSLNQLLSREGHIIYLDNLGDGLWITHVLWVLEQLIQNPKLISLIKKFKPPIGDLKIERLIRYSLQASEKEPLTPILLYTAVFSACFSLLRQNVGSCFATAPAILIQTEQLAIFLHDLHELIFTGQLSKTFAGVQLSVPISPSTGGGDLYKQIMHPYQIEQSPGLQLALQAAQLSFKKEDILQALPSPSLREMLETLLLKAFSLTKQDLTQYELMESSLIRTQGFGGVLTGHIPPAKISRIRQFLEKKEILESTFKACSDHPLVKVWEFTVASFAEVKSSFEQWNLYPGLGLHPDVKGGIGETIRSTLQHRLDSVQQELLEQQNNYEAAFYEAKAVGALLERAYTDSEARRLQAEYSSKLHQMQTYKEIKEKTEAQASACASFFPSLIKEYIRYFPDYFQEIYDANMQDITADIYEDSPAGFRLVYKHGRSKTSTWSLIYNSSQYLNALASFFSTVETQISYESEGSDYSALLSEVTTAILSLLQTPEFLHSAFARTAKAHKEPLPQDLDTASKKPWAYTSGGSMSMLLQAYYKKESPITEESFWVENTTDLLSTVITHTKTIPMSHKGILISSPTHAFILRLDFPLFRLGLETDLFPYSWVRDEVISPRRDFYASFTLSSQEQMFLVEMLQQKYPGLSLSSASYPLSIQEFRNHLSKDIPFDLLDAFLYESLPITTTADLPLSVEKLLEGLSFSFPSSYPLPSTTFLTARQLKAHAKLAYLTSQGSLCCSFDLHSHVEEKAAKYRLSPPPPVICADTNWPGYFFGFVVNPGTDMLELWRLDYVGSTGIKMSSWEPFVNGEDKTLWHIYTKPMQYS